MFVISFKSDKFKIAFIIFAVILLCVLGIVSVIRGSGSGNKPASDDGGISLRAASEDERIAFFSQYGWKIDEEPIQVKEIVIPNEFNDDLEKYNAIQKKQNLDLSDYKGETAKKWTYSVKNYPGYENTEGCVEGNIIVYEGMVIGGDISVLDKSNAKTVGFEFPTEVSEKVEGKN